MSGAVNMPPVRPLALVFADVAGNAPKAGLTFDSLPVDGGLPPCVRVTIAAVPANDRKVCAFVLPESLSEEVGRQFNRRARAAVEGKKTSITCEIPLWDADAQPAAAGELVASELAPPPAPIAVALPIAGSIDVPPPPWADVAPPMTLAQAVDAAGKYLRMVSGDSVAFVLVAGKEGTDDAVIATNLSVDGELAMLRAAVEDVESKATPEGKPVMQ